MLAALRDVGSEGRVMLYAPCATNVDMDENMIIDMNSVISKFLHPQLHSQSF